MKKSLVLIVSLAAAMLAQADILLWQVDAAALENTWKGDVPTSVTEARLVMRDGTEPGEVLQYAGINLDGLEGGSPLMEMQSVVLESAMAKQFYLELYAFTDGEASLAARSQLVSYNQLTEFMNSSLMTTDLKAWNGGSFQAVPEPTSGLLMLLGLAGLALRRRL